ncbi:MAG: hypothetical protein JWQ09_4131 [Segetibacter sp.]|nr:hypothetical protein [Segetibacter sp.]
MNLIIDPKDQSPEKNSIALQTRKCTNIANSQITNIAEAEIALEMSKFREQFLGITLRPNTISGIYNCHGMTFASRRTGIDIIDWSVIKEDNYERLENNNILAGDLVLYISDSGEIEHSGMVLSNIKDNPLSSLFVLSKWGSGSEVIHSLYNCPYNKSQIRFYRCEK